MTKTTCDICGKEIKYKLESTIKFVDGAKSLKGPYVPFERIEDMNFCISSHGRVWDICTECRVSLNKWMTKRRQQTEGWEV